jgi:hypothetical protein
VTDRYQRYQELGTVDERDTIGCKEETFTAQERNVDRKARKRMNGRKISKELSGEDVSYSESSVRNDLNKRNFSISISKRIRRISDSKEERGMAYCRDMLNTSINQGYLPMRIVSGLDLPQTRAGNNSMIE